MIVTCYVEGNEDRWEGICSDFDIAVHGASFPEVQRKLHTAIHAYLEYALSLPQDERERFLNRRVPLWVRLGFMFRVICSWIFQNRDHNGTHRHAYTLPCAA